MWSEMNTLRRGGRSSFGRLLVAVGVRQATPPFPCRQKHGASALPHGTVVPDGDSLCLTHESASGLFTLFLPTERFLETSIFSKDPLTMFPTF